MENISPSISLNIKTETGEELVEQARKLAEERAEEMKHSLGASPLHLQLRGYEQSSRVSLLASGDEGDDEPAILGTVYKPRPVQETEEQVLQYAAIHNGNVDITDASTVLKLPSDEVEQAMLTLMAQGKVKVNDLGGSEK
jgi:hypothetical protein